MFPIIELDGSAFERGQQHGRGARAQVSGSIANYKRLFAEYGVDWEQVTLPVSLMLPGEGRPPVGVVPKLGLCLTFSPRSPVT